MKLNTPLLRVIDWNMYASAERHKSTYQVKKYIIINSVDNPVHFTTPTHHVPSSPPLLISSSFPPPTPCHLPPSPSPSQSHLPHPNLHMLYFPRLQKWQSQHGMICSATAWSPTQSWYFFSATKRCNAESAVNKRTQLSIPSLSGTAFIFILHHQSVVVTEWYWKCQLLKSVEWTVSILFTVTLQNIWKHLSVHNNQWTPKVCGQ